jgi:hypothetical protein
MPLRKRSSGARRRRSAASSDASEERSDRRPSESITKAPLRVAYELGAILVELVRIPLRIWLRLAEPAGTVVLALWRVVWPAARAIGRGARRLLAAAERAVTPGRTAIVIALLAVAALVASQFVDYRAVEVGAPDYHGVTAVAPPPSVDAANPQSAHGAWVLVIAAVAIGVIAYAALSGRRRWARLLVLLGAVVVVIAIAVDAPQGLETGQAGIAYEGARATLRDGFGAEVAAACVLMLSGVLLAMYVPARDATPSPRRLRLGRRRAKRPDTAPRARSKPVRPGPPRKANG